MHTLISSARISSRAAKAGKESPATFREPNYDCRDLPGGLQVTVYVPGVESSGIVIEGHGTDLRITARKTRSVRTNWQALNLEAVQRDYQLRLRLGSGFDYAGTTAEIRQGVLTITLPKRPPASFPVTDGLAKVA